jgi:diaminohydroxyphosphoribosylaminopyrimidine deaminase/5-amino-6-(5-phosphoribosylamino)uracil reductase
MYVTLEPCCHQGKTGPCTVAVIAAGIRRVVVGQRDPFPQVAGQAIRQLEAAGLEVEVGVAGDEAARLNAPYHKLLAQQRPWVIAKWAMTLDGKLATRSGSSRWISNETSRSVAHDLRGRVDAVIIGSGTAAADDPLLTARPPGPRTATRVVLDSPGSIALDSQLVQTAREFPVLIAVADRIEPAKRRALEEQCCEVLVCSGESSAERFDDFLAELGRRRMTNVMIEGGGRVLGMAFDQGLVDEVHVFIAPKIVGGASAPSPVAGLGFAEMAAAWAIESPRIEQLDGDVYISGRTTKRTQ